MRLEFEPNVTTIPLVEDELIEEITGTVAADVSRLLKKGITAAQNGDRDSARSLLLRVTELDPANEDAWMWLASISEYPEELLAFLGKVLDLNPGNKRASEWRLATRSLLAKTFVQRGIEAHNEGSDELAAECFDQAVDTDANCDMAWMWKASITHDAETKTLFLERALSINPDNADARQTLDALKQPDPLALYHVAKVEAVGGKRKKALETLQDVLDSDEPHADAWILRSHLSQGFDEKLRALANALEVDPNNMAARAGYDFLEQVIGSTRTPYKDPAVDPHAPEPEILIQPVETAPATEPETEIAEPSAEEVAASIHETVEANRITLESLGPAIDDINNAETVFDQHLDEPGGDVYEIVADEADLDDMIHDTIMPDVQSEVQTEVSLPDLQVATSTKMLVCPYCSAGNDAQAFQCGSCHAVLTLSDIETLLACSGVDHNAVQRAVTRMEAEWNMREFDESELTTLGIGHFNLQNYDKGFKYLQEAARLDPNNVILAGQINSLAIRLEEKRRHDEMHDSKPVGCNILVVDDSPTVRKLISGKLEKCGHNVVCAADGVEGLEKIKESVPDLVLLDIAMPRMDGYQVCKQIRSDPASKDVPVVMISGKDGFFDKVRGRMAGSSGYITKPFGPETLMKTLDLYLNEDQLPR